MEKKPVREIEICFRGLDKISFGLNDFSYLDINNIERTLHYRDILNDGDSDLYDIYRSKSIFFELKAKANRTYKSSVKKSKNYRYVFDRIAVGDIFSIRIYYEDGTGEEFNVDFDNDNNLNKYQSCLYRKVNEKENLFVVIDRTCKAEEAVNYIF